MEAQQKISITPKIADTSPVAMLEQSSMMIAEPVLGQDQSVSFGPASAHFGNSPTKTNAQDGATGNLFSLISEHSSELKLRQPRLDTSPNAKPFM